jgi:hypothetical protein
MQNMQNMNRKTFSVYKIRYLDLRPHFLESTDSDNTAASS